MGEKLHALFTKSPGKLTATMKRMFIDGQKFETVEGHERSIADFKINDRMYLSDLGTNKIWFTLTAEMKAKGAIMPLPFPSSDEEKQEFMTRCMQDLKKEFKEPDQRYAVCLAQWNKKK